MDQVEDDVVDLALPGATVFLTRLPNIPYVWPRLYEQTDWQQREITMYGRKVLQPRLTAWYGNPGCAYSYSNIRNDPLPWTPLLSKIRENLKEILGYDFNSVLLNLYRDGKDTVGFHADDEKELGSEPVILSLSFGARRRFTFRHKRREYADMNVDLEDHSMLLMMGDTQKNWLHGIPRSSTCEKPRINLTFRSIRN